jgi:hypothetical protein
MTDQPRPPKAKPPAKKRLKRARPTKSPAQSLIGVFVLAAGIAAFVAVLYLGYVKFMSAPAPVDDGNGQGPPSVEQANQAGTQTERNQLRLNKARLGQMQGSWRTKYGAITGTLTLDEEENFDLVLYMDAVGFERLVVKGSYTYDAENGIMRMTPSYDRPPKVEGANIVPLTYRPYNIIVLRKPADGNILWVPHIKEGHRDQVHPIFVKMDVQDEYIEWSPQRN